MPARTEAKLNGFRFVFEEDAILSFHPFAGGTI